MPSPPTWWVIVGTGHEPGLTDLHVHASTSVEDHIFMAWALHRPIQHEIWRVVRGKRVFCGYKYIWDTPTITQQIQEGDTLFHSFYISALPPTSWVWYYLFAPDGPYGREIQGPLMGIRLLQPAYWRERVFFATRLKGMFRTQNFSGPQGPHPTWIPDNDGLGFLDLHQACPDPCDPYHRRFVICHGDLYRMDNPLINDPSFATMILSRIEANNLCGGTAGTIHWYANNANHPGLFYVLRAPAWDVFGAYCIRTTDYGQSWTPFLIDDTYDRWLAGNILAGINRGSSPHPAGAVLYTILSHYADHDPYIFRSTNSGFAWSQTATHPPGTGTWTARIYVDPFDQSILYCGGRNANQDLYRSIDHGDTWTLCDAGNHLGIAIASDDTHADMGTVIQDPDFIRVLAGFHLWDTGDLGVTWTDYGELPYLAPHLHFCHDSPDLLYLAHIANAPDPDGPDAKHVIFVTADQGETMFGKAGAHAHQDDGGGDSIPWNCGGVSREGILTLP